LTLNICNLDHIGDLKFDLLTNDANFDRCGATSI